MIKKIVRKIYAPIKLLIFKEKWRKINKHNFTKVKNIFCMDNIKVGKGTYGELKVKDFGSHDWKIEIGNYCSIAQECTFLTAGEHEYNNISTYPWKQCFFNIGSLETKSKGKIVIEDDVWIGYKCLIMSGVTIGQGAIIAAGSVVHKNVPPYAIYGGGKIIKYRFSEEIIQKLLTIDFSNIEKAEINNNVENFYKYITEENVDKLIEKLPKK